MITITLDKCIHELGLTMNRLASYSGTRPNTINDIVKGKAKRIDFDTIDKILNGLNMIALDRGIERRFDLHDVIQYELKVNISENGLATLSKDDTTD